MRKAPQIYDKETRKSHKRRYQNCQRIYKSACWKSFQRKITWIDISSRLSINASVQCWHLSNWKSIWKDGKFKRWPDKKSPLHSATLTDQYQRNSREIRLTFCHWRANILKHDSILRWYKVKELKINDKRLAEINWVLQSDKNRGKKRQRNKDNVVCEQ